MRGFSRIHAWIYRASGGRLATRTAQGYPVLLLLTRGRRSGKPRTTPLAYFEDDGRWVICGGSGGTATHPQWFRNLRADPNVSVQIEDRHHTVRAREADGSERDELWPKACAALPLVAEYQRQVERRVPVVVLEPVV